jgi:acetoin utilization deacetylase AcuC-like enzyme
VKLRVFYHPGYAAPVGNHVMPMAKFGLVADALRDWPDLELIEPTEIAVEDLRRVHTDRYIEAIRTGEPRELAESQKLPWSPDLYRSVSLTNGGCVAAARAALRDGASAALASGFHHACADHGEGFCTFNGLVVATDLLTAAGSLQRVTVLDLDLHYGNGTAQLAATRPYLQAISIYGNDYRDNIPHRDVRTRHHDDGENHRSFALPNGCDRATLLRTMDEAFPLVEEFRPGLLLYQAGADPYFEDPYSPLALNHEDLLARDERVFRFAREAAVPIAWVLAGGYTKDIRKVVDVHVNTFQAYRAVFG